jgi:hypothetical protein
MQLDLSTLAFELDWTGCVIFLSDGDEHHLAVPLEEIPLVQSKLVRTGFSKE